MSSDHSLSSYLADPDVQLMLRVQAGDIAAFAELMHRYQDRLMGLFKNFFRDTGISEDLVQEVFLRVHRAREKYRPEAKFKTWLYRIAVNVAKNKRRSMARRPEVSVPHVGDSSEQGLQAIALEKSGLMPTRIANSGELREQVQKAVMGLSDRQRMAVLLSKFEGMSYADVGETMGLSESAVKSLLVRARENLRDQLARFDSLDA